MESLLEFNCIVYLKNDEADSQAEKFVDMGIPVPEEIEEQEERIVKYSFDASNIAEVRETFIKYKGEWEDAVCATFAMTDKVITETPPLLVSYEEFKRKVNEYNQKSS